ncbi:hypothetical protein H7170_02370 [Candidatus Gracilibacteria bacterium]|nr:hypothetical protein [Candidatus Gracilibacteria bacterium]
MKKYILIIIVLFFTMQTYALSEGETATYKKWAIQEPKIREFEFQKKDCIGTTSDFSGTGDLLSSLVLDSIFRGKIIKEQYGSDHITRLNDINLVIDYTPEYLIGLDKSITKKLQKNFYVGYLCNIGKNIDIVAGNYSSKGRGSKVLILRKGNVISVLPKSIQLYNKSATGAGVSHCEAIAKNNVSFNWSCFVGLATDTNGVIGSKKKTYTISLKTGKIVQIRSYNE